MTNGMLAMASKWKENLVFETATPKMWQERWPTSLGYVIAHLLTLWNKRNRLNWKTMIT